MTFSGFENKTGNVISSFLFSAIVLLILILIFSRNNLTAPSAFFLLTICGIALISLFISDFISQKESKIVFISIFIISNIFVLSALVGSVFFREKNFGLVRSVMIFLVLFILFTSTTFLSILNFKDDSESYSQNSRKADAGVILGAAVWGGNRPSPVLKERINKGFEIYQKNIVPKLVITGGGSPNELTEGEVSKNVLLKYGVSPEDLILENSSSSTIEQIHFLRDSLYAARNWKKIILISDNFHLLRAKEISDFNGVNSDCISSDKELTASATVSFCLKESFALIVFWMTGV